MGSPKPSTRSVVPSNHLTSKKRTKVEKKKKAPKLGELSHSGRTYMNRLLNATIPTGSSLMEIAKANSLRSPLLNLPGELRNKVWQYAVGHHQINIHNYSTTGRWDIRLTRVALPLTRGLNSSSSFVPPTFAVPKVCRQMYVEASAMIYRFNNFGFDGLDTFDRWIKGRPLGQRRLIISVDIPFGYYSLYRNGFRKLFRQTFPGITKVRLHVKMAEMNQRVVPDTWFHIIPTKEPLEDTKKRFVDEVKKKEGEGIDVDWHSGTADPLVYFQC